MLRTAADQGISDVVNTIHFQHPKMQEREITLAYVEDQLAQLQLEVDRAGIAIKLHRGAEVFYLPNLLELAKNPVTTIGNGKYMLVEFQTYQLPEGYRQVLFDLVMHDITPIIAHPERYKPVQNDIDILRDLIDAGCLIQVDGGSLTGVLGNSARKAAEQLLARGLCQLLGSDAHDANHRNFCLTAAVEIGRSFTGDNVDRMVTDNPEKLIQGKQLEPEIAYIPAKAPNLMQKLRQRLWPV